MDIQPKNDKELIKELTERLAQADAVNHALQEEVERKKKALEGFIAENEALKAELGGKGKSNRREETTVIKTNGAAHQSADKQDAIALLRRLGG